MRVVIGIGNPDRGDDAAGLAVARLVRADAPAGVTVIELDGDQLALLDAWDGAAEVYLVDAARFGAEPGSVVRFDADTTLGGEFSRVGTHLLGLADAIELGRALHRLPARLTGFGIEGAGYELGAPLSAEAEHAARTVAEQILRELRDGR
jgi:hydrogenase maturation protease